ncbi:carboxypeptidase Q-like [Anticarsia gemmatalis]|uniref:carboxypeptidase Q-like n=1 Tax=Anticarsia gemmatalis TaxID=129554 RepID=UPI003F75F601
MPLKFTALYIIVVLIVRLKCMQDKNYSEEHLCDVGPLAEEIVSYRDVVQSIIEYTVSGPFKGKTYEELAKFVDKFGARITGSEVLEQSIDYMIELAREESLNDVFTEDVEVPHWVRGEEKITMLKPRVKNIAVLGLGPSVPTPPGGITAEVVVISNFTMLDDTPDEHIRGKIVLYTPTYTTYGETVKYRTQGATKASAKGAIASLVKSITPFSIYSPHTGYQKYGENVTKIPTAAITLEDADLIKRINDRGEKVELHIEMSSTFDKKTSRNTIIDIKGSEHPEKLVIVSGHIDSWDVGEGAMDDGGGLLISLAAPVILKRLNLTPKRTVRSIFWTAEELGLVGAQAYEKAHRNESDNIDFIMESDEGTFRPRGLTVGGTQEARCIVAEVLKLFNSINCSTLVETDSPGSDITVFTKNGIPGAGLLNDNERYFWFHHSEGDTINVENPEDLDLGAAFWAAVAYVIADMSADIPR